MTFDGKTFDYERDNDRLQQQLGRVRKLMLDGKWRTLEQIEQSTGDPTASISARLRDLRKTKFGAFCFNLYTSMSFSTIRPAACRGIGDGVTGLDGATVGRPFGKHRPQKVRPRPYFATSSPRSVEQSFLYSWVV